jgi:hypothetical protein
MLCVLQLLSHIASKDLVDFADAGDNQGQSRLAIATVGDRDGVA